MANKRANPLSGYFKSPPTAEKSKEAAKAEMEAEAGILGSTGEEQKPPEQTKDGKEQKAPAANGPAKPGEEQKPPEQTKDPTQKPVALCEYLIRTYTQPGELVADICAGSGTTAVAALRAGRNFICFENNPQIYNMAMERISGVISDLHDESESI